MLKCMRPAGLFRYTFGRASNFDEASVIKQELKTKGYPDAFVVAFMEGKRISVGEATRLLKD